MNTQESQETRLIVAFENIKRMTTRAQSVDSVPHGEFVMMFVINTIMRKKDPLNPDAGYPGVMISKLSELLQISRPTASQMISSMEEKGLVERVMSLTDRRVVYICLTDKGQAVFGTKMAQYSCILNEIIEKVGTEEVDQLITLCERFQTVVSEVKRRQAGRSPEELSALDPD